MINVNFAVVAGNVASQAELRYTKNQKPVTTFTVATNAYRDGEQLPAQYHRIVCWVEAENYAGLMKGDFVTVTGELRTRSYEKDGKKNYITEIVAHTVTVGVTPTKSNFADMANGEEEIPF